MLKAFVIKINTENKDLGDVVQIARALGKQAFKENVSVKRIYGPDPEIGYVVVVEGPGPSCSDSSGVRGAERKMNG